MRYDPQLMQTSSELVTLKLSLKKLADPVRAEHSQRFFKIGKGEYGEGDKFLGIKVPELRKLARKYKRMAHPDVLKLLKSPYHEERLLSVIILVSCFELGSQEEQQNIFDIYLNNTRHINNWDIVDSSASQIIGAHLLNAKKDKLFELANSESLWERRIAIIATFHFIKNDKFTTTFKLTDLLINDQEDLIHKATGWMLREIGNRDREAEINYLNKNYQAMPRTMLRYAIEKLPEKLRQDYLKSRI